MESPGDYILEIPVTENNKRQSILQLNTFSNNNVPVINIIEHDDTDIDEGCDEEVSQIFDEACYATVTRGSQSQRSSPGKLSNHFVYNLFASSNLVI